MQPVQHPLDFIGTDGADPADDDRVRGVVRMSSSVEPAQELRLRQQVPPRFAGAVSERVEPASPAGDPSRDQLAHLGDAAEAGHGRAVVRGPDHDEPADRGKPIAAGTVSVVIGLAGQQVARHEATHRVCDDVRVQHTTSPQHRELHGHQVGGIGDRLVVGVLEAEDDVSLIQQRRGHVTPMPAGIIEAVDDHDDPADTSRQRLQRRARIVARDDGDPVTGVGRHRHGVIHPLLHALEHVLEVRRQRCAVDSYGDAVRLDRGGDRVRGDAIEDLHLQPAERRAEVDGPIKVLEAVPGLDTRRAVHRLQNLANIHTSSVGRDSERKCVRVRPGAEQSQCDDNGADHGPVHGRTPLKWSVNYRSRLDSVGGSPGA